jgi:hypothetical protein
MISQNEGRFIGLLFNLYCALFSHLPIFHEKLYILKTFNKTRPTKEDIDTTFNFENVPKIIYKIRVFINLPVGAETETKMH